MDSDHSARHRRIVLLVFVLLAAATAGCTSNTETPDPSRSDAGGGSAPLDDALTDLEDGGFSGVVLIDDQGELTIEGMGMADREAGIANGPGTVFDIGSLATSCGRRWRPSRPRPKGS